MCIVLGIMFITIGVIVYLTIKAPPIPDDIEGDWRYYS